MDDIDRIKAFSASKKNMWFRFIWTMALFFSLLSLLTVTKGNAAQNNPELSNYLIQRDRINVNKIVSAIRSNETYGVRYIANNLIFTQEKKMEDYKGEALANHIVERLNVVIEKKNLYALMKKAPQVSKINLDDREKYLVEQINKGWNEPYRWELNRRLIEDIFRDSVMPVSDNVIPYSLEKNNQKLEEIERNQLEQERIISNLDSEVSSLSSNVKRTKGVIFFNSIVIAFTALILFLNFVIIGLLTYFMVKNRKPLNRLLKLLQKEDSSLLQVGEINDFPGLISSLKNDNDPAKKMVWQLLSDECRKSIYKHNINTPLKEQFKSLIITDLNAILARKDFYSEEVFKEYKLSNECMKNLRDGMDRLSEDEIKKVNRSLLEAIYPQFIVKKRKEEEAVRYNKVLMKNREEDFRREETVQDGKLEDSSSNDSDEYSDNIKSKAIDSRGGHRNMAIENLNQRQTFDSNSQYTDRKSLKNEVKVPVSDKDKVVKFINSLEAVNKETDFSQFTFETWDVQVSREHGYNDNLNRSRQNNPQVEMMDINGPFKIWNLDGGYYLFPNSSYSNKINGLHICFEGLGSSGANLEVGDEAKYVETVEPAKCSLIDSIGRIKIWEIIQKGKIRLYHSDAFRNSENIDFLTKKGLDADRRPIQKPEPQTINRDESRSFLTSGRKRDSFGFEKQEQYKHKDPYRQKDSSGYKDPYGY